MYVNHDIFYFQILLFTSKSSDLLLGNYTEVTNSHQKLTVQIGFSAREQVCISIDKSGSYSVVQQLNNTILYYQMSN